MADTILILGNGFDLAMGRKTSYKDFLEFAEKLFPTPDKEYKNFLTEHKISTKKYKDNLYLRYIRENRNTLGENWSNLEIMISQLAEAIDFFKLNSEKLYYKGGFLYPNLSDSFRKAMSVEDNSTSKMFIGTIFSELYKKLHWEMLERGLAISELNNEFIRHLDLLTELLEIYLSYRDYIDFEIEQIIPSETALNAIDEISEASVISFNYTHTPNKLYKIPLKKTHFIHGEINLKRHDYEINNGLIPYQKFYQRIVKETGNMYEKFFTDRSKDIWGSKPLLNIVVFGHSVDPLDKEIFRKCFDLLKDSSDYRFIFTYYDDSTKRSIIKNLAIILGKDRLIELTGQRKVVFVKSEDVGGMSHVLLE